MLQRPLALGSSVLLFALGCASSPPPAPCAPAAAAAASAAPAPAPAPQAASAAPAAPAAPVSDETPGEDLAKLTSEDLARKLVELTGGADMGKQILVGMAENMKKLPGLPPGFIERLEQGAHPEDLTAMIVPIYARNYERETLIAAIHFYETKQGHNLIAKLPKVTQESMEAGREWGKKVAARALKDLPKPGPGNP